MKKLFTILCFAIFAVGLSSCDNGDHYYYYNTVSGEGSLSIDTYYPYGLYRMVTTSSDDESYVYLLGGTNTVKSSGSFTGRGAAVYFKYDSTDASVIDSETLTIGENGVEVGYSTYVDYDRDDEDLDYTALESGSIQVVWGTTGYYKIRILGIDSEGRSISIAYNGYIYASFADDTSGEGE